MDDKVMFWGMIFLMAIFSYIIMSNVMLTFRNGIYNHVNKAYMALLMGSLMGMIYYILQAIEGHHTKDVWYGLLIWTIISLAIIILIRQQIAVNNSEFIKGMIEHHDAALLMSDQLIKKSNDPVLKDFAEHIIKTQQDEINWMKVYLAGNCDYYQGPKN